MKIYYLDQNPLEAADAISLYHYSQTILFYTQLLGNAHHLSDSAVTDKIYKPNQLQHPYTKWVASGEDNYQWLLKSLIRLLMNYEEHRHKQHNTRAVIKYLMVPPARIKNQGIVLPESALNETYRGAIDITLAHQAYYTDLLKNHILQGHTIDFYYKIPSWTDFIEVPREEEFVKNPPKYTKKKLRGFKRSTCTIPIVRASLKNLSKWNKDLEVDIRRVAEMEKDEDEVC